MTGILRVVSIPYLIYAWENIEKVFLKAHYKIVKAPLNKVNLVLNLYSKVSLFSWSKY